MRHLLTIATILFAASADFSGNGLGLSIVKHIAELHGGTLDIKPTASGTGVLLQVVLPLCILTAGERVMLPRSIT